MTADLFSKWLMSIDAEMRREKRKFLMFIDNCTAHKDVPSLENIELKYIPPNTTSILQPLDQGIFKNLKPCIEKKWLEL